MIPRVLPVAVLLLAHALGFPEHAAAGSPKQAETAAILRMLNEPLDLKDLHKEPEEGSSYKSPFDFISERFAAKGTELPFYFNREAFKEGTKARQVLDGQLPFRIPTTPRRLPAVAFLRILLSQYEDVEATFLIRNGVVEILPAKQATLDVLLQRKVTGAFDRTILEEVLQDLSYQTGATLVLDTHAEEQAKTRITATFRNEVTLEAALRMVTEMAQLKLVVMPGGLFVTTPAHAEILHKERLTQVPSRNPGK